MSLLSKLFGGKTDAVADMLKKEAVKAVKEAAPIALAVWLCAGLLYVSSFLFGLASTALAILAVVVIMAGSPINGIILLGIAFLVSPLGLPLLAVQMLGGLQRMRNALVNWF